MHQPPTAGSVSRRSALIAAATVALGPAASAADASTVKASKVAEGLAHPWGLAFLPGFEQTGRMLVTERPGRMRIVSVRGEIGPALEGLPRVEAVGEGGLLDVALHPGFAGNRLVYWCYAERAEGGTSTVVARGRLEATSLRDVQVIFRQIPKSEGRVHFGARLLFAPDGRLFVTLGDHGHRDDAQTLDNHHGKIVRIEDDGRAPRDNPFVGRPGALPEIWSYGHRNVQGAAFHPVTGELWTSEHGPQGGDEINVVERGKNYGWPVITYGVEYGSGRKIGEGTAKAGMEQPVTYWVPISIAPSGIAFVTSDRYPAWKGSLLVAALRGQMLVRLQLDGRKVAKEEHLLTDLNERLRHVRQGPDGWLYLLTDSPQGRVLRLQA